MEVLMDPDFSFLRDKLCDHLLLKLIFLINHSFNRGGVSAGAAGALHPRFFGNSLLETKKMEVFHQQIYSSQGVCTRGPRILTPPLPQCDRNRLFLNFLIFSNYFWNFFVSFFKSCQFVNGPDTNPCKDSGDKMQNRVFVLGKFLFQYHEKIENAPFISKAIRRVMGTKEL